MNRASGMPRAGSADVGLNEARAALVLVRRLAAEHLGAGEAGLVQGLHDLVVLDEPVAVPEGPLPPGAVGWAVAAGRRCSDATRISQGEHAAQLSEDDTRHAIEVSMLSLLRRLCGDSSVPVPAPENPRD